ncbi:MAG: DUF975 family protein [Clostridia bacterium]|nr:DUF975 family protein [Clostridia bacterium]
MNQDFYQTPEGESPFTRVKNAAYYRSQARTSLKPYWGIAIIVTLLAMLLGGVSEGFSFNFSFDFSNAEAEIEESIPLTEEQAQKVLEYLEKGDYQSIINAITDRVPALSTLFPILLFFVILATVFSIAFSLFVSSPVKLGYQRFQLELIDNNTTGIQVQTLFRFFKESYFKSIGLNILHGLILFATSLPLLIFTVIGVINFFTSIAVLITTAETIAALDVALSALGMAGLILLGAIITTVIRIPITYMYAYAHMIMAEYPTIGVIDALRNSRNLMRGNKWKLFCLEISFIGWIILSAFTCGIGMIVLQPYMEAAKAAFYHDISNRDTAKEVEFPSLNPDDYIAQ